MEKSTQKTKVLKLHEHSVINADEYPEDWRFLSLGDPISGNFSNGVNKDAKDYGNGCLFVNISDVFREFTVDPKKLGRVNVTDEEIENYKLEKGDLVLDRSSNIFETVGYPTYFDGYEEPVVFSGFTLRYRPNKGNWYSKFLTYQLMSYPIRKLVTSISTKSVNSNVNQNSYKKIQVPCPPIQEQQKIASILSNADSLINQTRKEIEQTQRLKKGLMQRLLTKGIGHTKFKTVKTFHRKTIQIPESWKWTTLGNECEINSGGTPSRSHPEYFEGKILWVPSTELDYNTITKTNECITLEAVKKSNLKIYPKGTFVIAIIGLEASRTRGRCALLGCDATISQSCAAIEPSNKIIPKFLFYFYQNFSEKVVFTLAQGTKQQNFYPYLIDLTKIALPPIPEQQKIIEILTNVDLILEKLDFKKQTLFRLKKGLMQKLLTGQIRVKV